MWLQGQLRLLPEDKELAGLLLCTEVLRGSEAQVVQVLQEPQVSGQRLAQESLLQGKLTCPVWLQGQLCLLQEDKELARVLLCTEVLRGSEAQVVQVEEHQVCGQRLAQESLLQGKLTCPVWLQGQLRLLPEDKELALLLCREVLQGSEAQVVQVQEHQVSGQRLAQESLLWQGKLTCPVWLLEQLRLLEEDKLARLLLCTEVLQL